MKLFEQVLALYQPSLGLDGYMVLHDTARGPATGGIRLFDYASDDEALRDGIRLAEAMTLKAAAADLPVGGGKIVLRTPPPERRREALAAVGRSLEAMGGRFLAGRDVGLPVADGAIVRSETAYMVDESEQGVGDLNRRTAEGVLAGMRAALCFRLGTPAFEGVTVAIQGVGGVGAILAELLSREGAVVKVSDSNPKALAELRARVSFAEVALSDIVTTDADVFAPCAVGGVLDASIASAVRARIVAGSANNVLTDDDVADVLEKRGVTYVPDVLINAGALIQGVRFLRFGERASSAAIAGIGERTADLLERARAAAEAPTRALLRELNEAGRA